MILCSFIIYASNSSMESNIFASTTDFTMLIDMVNSKLIIHSILEMYIDVICHLGTSFFNKFPTSLMI